MTEKIDEISIVFPCEADRMSLTLKTLSAYLRWGLPPKLEVVLVSRTFRTMDIPGFDIKVVSYNYEGEYFCPSLAFNLGVKIPNIGVVKSPRSLNLVFSITELPLQFKKISGSFQVRIVFSHSKQGL